MRFHAFRRLLAVTAMVGLCASCGSSSTSSRTSTSSTGEAASTSGSASGALNVFAAASLTAAFNDGKIGLGSTNPNLTVTYNFAGSNALVTQIRQGAPADVFASADQKNMTTLFNARVVEAPVVFATNRLQIAVAPTNPKGITGLADLAKPGVSVVVAAPGVPAGDYTREVTAKLGISITPKSLETDVKSALTKVTSGEVDATVVYLTDVRAAGSKAVGVDITEAQQPAIAYPIAIVKATKNRAAAEAFVRSATSGAVQQSLMRQGFIAP